RWVVLGPLDGYPAARVAALDGPGFAGASRGPETVAVDLTPLLGELGPRLRLGLEQAGLDGRWTVLQVRVVVER
ncbi:MAG: hypothetical protein KIT58_20885, partial [Planctomycetota bacterium]|nr:hypothetical protein [Planctomycetota bacterium]